MPLAYAPGHVGCSFGEDRVIIDAGEIDPEGDVEAQFLEWRQVHEQVVSGEVHYKAILEAARMTIRSIIRSSASVPRSVRHAGAGGNVAPLHPPV